jgi:hypothetical protein
VISLSPRERGEGRGEVPARAVAVAFVAVMIASPAAVVADSTPLRDTLAGTNVAWDKGTLEASAGAAADLRMPSVDLARPGAERRAQAAGQAKLRAALAALPLGQGHKLTAPEIDRAVGRARSVDVQYQSNGGAIVRVELKFGDWLEAPSPQVVLTLAVKSMRLAAAPTARIAGRDVRIGAATYLVGDAGRKEAVDAKVDKDGRLVLAGDAALADKLARGAVLIYVGKVLR